MVRVVRVMIVVAVVVVMGVVAVVGVMGVMPVMGVQDPPTVTGGHRQVIQSICIAACGGLDAASGCHSLHVVKRLRMGLDGHSFRNRIRLIRASMKQPCRERV